MLATDAQTKPKAKTWALVSLSLHLESLHPVPCCVTARDVYLLHRVNITFIDRDGDEHTVQGKLGSTLLEVAKEYDIDLEGG